MEIKTTPGFKVEKIQNKMSLKVVQNGLITMENIRVPEENRLQDRQFFPGHREGVERDPIFRGLGSDRLRDGRL